MDEGVTTFLDWELALWGDPVYDLAVHLHKMTYLPEEQEALVSRWLTNMPTTHTAGWEHDLDTYLAHERIKSAIVDAIRYSRAFANDRPSPYPPYQHQVIDMMTARINTARVPWGIRDPITPNAVADAFQTPTPRAQGQAGPPLGPGKTTPQRSNSPSPTARVTSRQAMGPTNNLGRAGDEGRDG